MIYTQVETYVHDVGKCGRMVTPCCDGAYRSPTYVCTTKHLGLPKHTHYPHTCHPRQDKTRRVPVCGTCGCRLAFVHDHFTTHFANHDTRTTVSLSLWSAHDPTTRVAVQILARQFTRCEFSRIFEHTTPRIQSHNTCTCPSRRRWPC